MTTFSICICTYRRPAQLTALLARLADSVTPPPILEVVVVDNDAEQSARAAVAQFQATAQPPFALRYDTQPAKNISLTRNRSVALAQGDWLGFLDDDELPGRDWLARMYETAVRFEADGVLAPVLSQVPDDAPEWIRKGDFYGRRRFETGTPVPGNERRIGNALLRAELLRRIEGPFDPAYGLTGGEDGRMLYQLGGLGAKLVWCDEAVVVEPVEPSRLNRRWILRRALRGGQDHARHYQAGLHGPLRPWSIPLLVLRAAAQCAAAAVLTLLSWPLGETQRIRWMRLVYSNAGKLLALLRWHYREYG